MGRNHVMSCFYGIDEAKIREYARLIARTECVKDGKTTCVYQTEIMDDLGRKVALVTGTGYKL